MALRYSDNAAIAMCDATVDLVDVGAANGTIEIYDGTRPASPEIAVTTQSLLLGFDLEKPAFADAETVDDGATADLIEVDPVDGAADGDAAWFRIYDGDGNPCWDGTISLTGGGGDLKLSAITVVTGIPVTIVSMSYTQPKGWTA